MVDPEPPRRHGVLEPDPVKHARSMIAPIDGKRKARGIDKARERTLVDITVRRELESG
jgi:anaerobic carbon-monoxide dehydrogenase catalytic subunit